MLLYGAGDFLHFMLNQYDFSQLCISISDKNSDALQHWKHYYSVIELADVRDQFDVIIPMSMAFEQEMKQSLQDKCKISIPVELVNWKELKNE